MDLLNFSDFEHLIEDAQKCTKCEQMCHAQKVLTWANGVPDARVMFIAEAPGRLGADRTMIPLHGDKAGDNFEKLLKTAGFDRRSIFVTNAVLCNPRDDSGNNRPPSNSEIQNCTTHLRRQIDVVNPDVIATLGIKALAALEIIESHGLSLSVAVRQSFSWYGRKLVPLYHPGTRALIHRNFHNQTADYYFLAEQLKRKGRKPVATQAARRGSPDSWSVVAAVLQSAGETSLFKLHKLLYLVDHKFLQTHGTTLTDFHYLRQKDGPYCVNLGRGWSRENRFDIRERSRNGYFYYWREASMFSSKLDLPDEIAEFVAATVDQYSGYDERAIKTAAYLTKPMKDILRAEKAGHSMLNAPIFSIPLS